MNSCGPENVQGGDDSISMNSDIITTFLKNEVPMVKRGRSLPKHPDSSWPPSSADVARFQDLVFDWYSLNGRDLPWRHTRDPYAVLVSEIMLQQTQVSRVLRYFEPFLAEFPTAEVLALAPLRDVLSVWQGLGYNRRAANLRRAATVVVAEYDGSFPSAWPDLQRLPGVGRYTARAVACFAFEQQLGLVEVNIRRALRVFMARIGFDGTFDEEALADLLVPPGQAWMWNQALMDYGSTLPRPKPMEKGEAVPFLTTDRYWRGRIVSALCRQPGPLPVSSLIRELPKEAEEYRIRSLLDQLAHDGLVGIDLANDSASIA
jgi:A/G-specific adenine glycosylase